jgi:hypothetical protein
MSEPQNGAPAPLESIQRDWSSLTLRMAQAETERTALEIENKNLRTLLERAIEHRQKSHTELVNILATLVSKLPLNDVGIIVAKLVEHNAHVGEVSASLINGKLEENQLQPAILKQLDKTKRDLAAMVSPAVEELIKLDSPLDAAMLQSFVANPENFFAPAAVRASRGFVKGQLPRERVLKEFGPEALPLFRDVTTDLKFNPRPKPEEIMFVFADDFEAQLAQNSALAGKRSDLLALFQKVRATRENSEKSRAMKNAFLRLSFVLELIHYYDHTDTESPDVVFAQRLPPLIEQLVITGERDTLDEKLLVQAETLLAFILSADYRNSVINNLGKGGGQSRTLRYTLTFRAEKLSDIDPVTQECVKFLLPPGKVPTPESLLPVLRLFNPHMQQSVVRAFLDSDRLRKDEAQALVRTLAKELGLVEIENQLNSKTTISPERESQLAWENIRNLIGSRAAPSEIAAAVRKRLHAKYDGDEIKASWVAVTEGDPLVFVRVFCLLPYLPDGSTDPVARAVLETYVTRLTHDKYAAVYAKVLNALKNLYKVKADSPALVNFIALAKWVDAVSADKIVNDIGMTA